jgi:hypothetical protein
MTMAAVLGGSVGLSDLQVTRPLAAAAPSLPVQAVAPKPGDHVALASQLVKLPGA